MLIPATRPCLLATVPSAWWTGRPETTCIDWQQSPGGPHAWHRCALLAVDDDGIASPGRQAGGRGQAPSSGRPRARGRPGRPGSRRPRCAPPSRRWLSTVSPVRTVMPMSRMARATSAPISGSRVPMTSSARLDDGHRRRPARRTPRPSPARCSRSRPRPPGGRRAGPAASASRAAASSRVCTPWTWGRSIPGRSGRRGMAPVATCTWSNPRLEGAAVGPVVHLGLAGRPGRGRHLVLGAHVDPHGPELLRRAGHQVVESHGPPHRRDRECRTPSSSSSARLDGHDLQVGRAAASLGGGGHPGRVASDHQQAVSHHGDCKGARGRAPSAPRSGRHDRGNMGGMGVRADCRHYRASQHHRQVRPCSGAGWPSTRSIRSPARTAACSSRSGPCRARAGPSRRASP